MKLNELSSKKAPAARALKEHYAMPFDLSKMSLIESRNMLQKVRGLITEARQSATFYKSQHDTSYLKLVFMEQALSSTYNDLRARPTTRVVLENEAVEKSQVVLAAQDMVDSVQKMLEQVSDMLVKEMPALIDSVQSEIGVNEAEQFSSQTTEALGSLTASLTQTKTALQGALNVITGQGGGLAVPGAFDSESDTVDMEEPAPEDDLELDDIEEPEQEEPELNNIGRNRR